MNYMVCRCAVAVASATGSYLKEHDFPHIWNVDDHGHDGEMWGNNLYQFAQKLSR